jgi:D-inositol-3-phosphate glycosyltransferase
MYQTSTCKGQELVAQRMVRDFIAQGHVAYLITSVYHDGTEVVSAKSLRNKKGYVFVKDSELEIPIIRVDSYVVKWPRRRINFKDLIQVLAKIVDEFNLNVLITHSTLWNGPEEVAKFVSWRRRMRDLGGYRDPIVFCHMSHYQEPTEKRYSLSERTFRMAWNTLSLSQILKTANMVIVVTPLEKEAKVKMGCDPRKCFLFPGGVQEESFIRFAAADTKDFRKQHNLPEKVKFVSYLGSLEPRKNPESVLKVAEQLKHRSDIHFLIAGKGDSEYTNKIKEEASQLPNVTYLGEVNTKEKIQLIKSSFANIIMSRLEALGLAQLEFMYGGVPIVTSGVGGQAWLVRNNQEGLHTKGPDDISGAVEAILRLAGNRDLWKKLSRNAKEKARSMTTSHIMEKLDAAITKEMMKESGLELIPTQARDTMEQPEHVLKSWSLGSWRVVATDQRLFIKEGRLSRRIAEIPHANIAYVEHSRRYSWKPLLIGFLPAIIILLEPLWRFILKETFVSNVESLLALITQSISAVVPPHAFLYLLALIPAFVGLVFFALESRVGFNIHVMGAKPVYLPHRLGEVISFRRGLQEKRQKIEKPRKPSWEFPKNGLSLNEDGRIIE